MQAVEPPCEVVPFRRGAPKYELRLPCTADRLYLRVTHHRLAQSGGGVSFAVARDDQPMGPAGNVLAEMRRRGLQLPPQQRLTFGPTDAAWPGNVAFDPQDLGRQTRRLQVQVLPINCPGANNWDGEAACWALVPLWYRRFFVTQYTLTMTRDRIPQIVRPATRAARCQGFPALYPAPATCLRVPAPAVCPLRQPCGRPL